ncbi:MAG: amidohydrolase family protein [Leptolyngbyaceae cyanobacterium SL_7_1]|nr:amidohydrolase family protein [Leptolyngbyaceae cyanobacterium SL_7_1]
MLEFTHCIILHGAELDPYWCDRLVVDGDTIQQISLRAPCRTVDQGALVIMPGLYNCHTHVGDSCLPDGATGMSLEAGFFRPDGYKYRELAKRSEAELLFHIVNHLGYMTRTGTIGHIDFREQGLYGSQLLRKAADQVGIDSIILGQFNCLPFTPQELHQNQAELSPQALLELESILSIADGFSESTMNDLTDRAWLQIREIVQRHNKFSAIHCLENQGYRETSVAITGRGDLERAIDLYRPNLVIHATVANEMEIALLSTHRMNLALNPRANANLGLPLPPIAKLMESDANLLLGTDNGLLNSPNLFAELDFTYKVAKSQFGDAVRPDPRMILQMVTSNVRSLLHNDTYGYLEQGLPADFIVLDFTQPHLRASRNIFASIVTRVTPEDVIATVRRGHYLFRAERYGN